MPHPAVRTDEALAAEACEGSRAAFEQLVERYGGPVVDLIARRVGDHHTALDLAQDAWVRLFKALPRFDATRYTVNVRCLDDYDAIVARAQTAHFDGKNHPKDR